MEFGFKNLSFIMTTCTKYAYCTCNHHEMLNACNAKTKPSHIKLIPWLQMANYFSRTLKKMLLTYSHYILNTATYCFWEPTQHVLQFQNMHCNKCSPIIGSRPIITLQNTFSFFLPQKKNRKLENNCLPVGSLLYTVKLETNLLRGLGNSTYIPCQCQL